LARRPNAHVPDNERLLLEVFPVSWLRNAVKGVYRTALAPRVRWELARLSRNDNPFSSALATALRGALQNGATREEQAWIDRIEALRAALESDHSEISIVDYGVGQPGQTRTEREMSAGTVATDTIADVCINCSKPYFWSLLLFKMVRELRPSVCLELGTCLGLSGAYQAAALCLNRTGTLVTLEGAESLATHAREHFHTLGLDNVTVVVGRFQDTLGKVLQARGPIDYAFIDGHHDERATLAYFEQILPFTAEKAVLVFDDISWSEGMKRAWAALKRHPRVAIAVDLRTLGVCSLGSDRQQPECFTIPIV
jgi:methyltransferase family protein